MNKNQDDERNDVLVHTVSVVRLELVAFLAARSDQISLDAAMGVAISRADIKMLEHLIAREANPHSWHEEFLLAMSYGHEDIVALLLSSRHLPCLDCRSKALAIAVEYSLLKSLQLLIRSGADVEFDGGEALKAAVGACKSECVAILVTGPSPPSKQSLDLALFGIYYSMSDPNQVEELDGMKLCLARGAGGHNTDQLMITVVQRRQSVILDLIIENFKAPQVNYDNGAAIRHAIKTEQLSILEKLLALHPSEIILSTLINTAMDAENSQTRLEAVTRLLASEARGSNVAKALVVAVQ